MLRRACVCVSVWGVTVPSGGSVSRATECVCVCACVLQVQTAEGRCGKLVKKPPHTIKDQNFLIGKWLQV